MTNINSSANGKTSDELIFFWKTVFTQQNMSELKPQKFFFFFLMSAFRNRVNYLYHYDTYMNWLPTRLLPRVQSEREISGP